MRHDNTHPSERVYRPRFVSIQDTYTYRPLPEPKTRDWQTLSMVMILVILALSAFIGG